VPKLIIYDPDEALFSESDTITIAFLFLLGFDICILTPTGYANIETCIQSNQYSVFKLAQKSFELALPNLSSISTSKNKGFWSNLFNQN
jgi:hypothetical protein